MAVFRLALFLTVLGATNAVIVDKCALARVLQARGVPGSQLGDWLCLVQYESSYNTAATHRNNDGSIDYGIFQINSAFWCSNSAPRTRDCKITCSALLDNDINNDIACAQLIYRRHKFNAWYGWKNRCRGTNTRKYLDGCRL